MKTKIFILGLLAVMLFTLFGCCKECQKELDEKTAELIEIKKTCPDCRISTITNPDFPKNTNLALKIDYKDVKDYQPFVLDILNGFGILGKLTMNKNDGYLINKVELYFFEIGDCKRYDIQSAVYEGKKEGGPHRIVFKLNEFTGDGDRLSKSLNMNGKKFKIKVGDLIDMKIKSEKHPHLNATIRMGDSGGSFVPFGFPPFICTGQIINGDIE